MAREPIANSAIRAPTPEVVMLLPMSQWELCRVSAWTRLDRDCVRRTEKVMKGGWGERTGLTPMDRAGTGASHSFFGLSTQ